MFKNLFSIAMALITSFSVIAKEVVIDFNYVSIVGNENGLSGRLNANKFFIDADGDHILIDQIHGPYESNIELKNQRLFFKSDNFTLSTPIELRGASSMRLELFQGQYISRQDQFRATSGRVVSKDLTLHNFTFQTSPFLLEAKEKLKHVINNTFMTIERLSTQEKLKVLDKENKGIIDIDDLSNLELRMSNGSVSLKGKVKILARISFRMNAIASVVNEGLLLDIEDVTIASVIPARALVLHLLKSALESEIVVIDSNKILIKI
ncbi:MAG: hypothetical protein OHK0056_22220 [Bacteriovoracaceae bacterium]